MRSLHVTSMLICFHCYYVLFCLHVPVYLSVSGLFVVGINIYTEISVNWYKLQVVSNVNSLNTYVIRN